MRRPTDKAITSRLRGLIAQREHYQQHMQVISDRRDLHGVMDCAADLRELDSAIRQLEWVLGVPHDFEG